MCCKDIAGVSNLPPAAWLHSANYDESDHFGPLQYIRDADQMAKDAEIAKNYTRKMFARHIEEVRACFDNVTVAETPLWRTLSSDALCWPSTGLLLCALCLYGEQFFPC